MEYLTKFNVADVPIYDQGNIGRCVMEALRSVPHAATGVEPGATFGYGYWRSHSRTGMIIDEACNGFVRDGIPPRSVDSADLEMPEAKYYAENHKERLLKAAEPYKGWQWARANNSISEGVALQLYTSYSSRVKTFDGTASRWWLSSRYDATKARYVNLMGTSGYSTPNNTNGVVPAFVIPLVTQVENVANADGSYNLIY